MLWLLLIGTVFADSIPLPGPESQFLASDELSASFCSRWNPDFNFKGKQCCEVGVVRHKRRGAVCSPRRVRAQFCGEMTVAQRQYLASASQGKLPDVLEEIQKGAKFQQGQSYCSPNDGFLAWGRPVVPTVKNRIVLRRPAACINFGTDSMVGMLEWLGREVAKEYPQTLQQLVVGDISAPRGGCIPGRWGRKGHSSHTNGLDVDIGFISAAERSSTYIEPQARGPAYFNRQFDAASNAWLLKKVFTNPFACVERVFLDRKLIQKLKKVLVSDPLWAKIHPHLQHVRGHRDHIHIRVGEYPGAPGCGVAPDQAPEFEAPELATAENKNHS